MADVRMADAGSRRASLPTTRPSGAVHDEGERRADPKPNDTGRDPDGQQRWHPDANVRLNLANPSHRVLIIEDDTVLSDVMAEVFREEGWQAEVRHDALGALSSLITTPPDLLVLDINLERPDAGWILIMLLREDLSTTRSLPVIVCTGLSHVSPERIAWLEHRNIPIISKPFDLDALVNVATSAAHSTGRVSGEMAS